MFDKFYEKEDRELRRVVKMLLFELGYEAGKRWKYLVNEIDDLPEGIISRSPGYSVAEKMGKIAESQSKAIDDIRENLYALMDYLGVRSERVHEHERIKIVRKGKKKT